MVEFTGYTVTRRESDGPYKFRAFYATEEDAERAVAQDIEDNNGAFERWNYEVVETNLTLVGFDL